MVAIWGRFFPKLSKQTKQAVEEQPPTPDWSDRLEIYKKFSAEDREERGGSDPYYRPAPRTRYIQRYF